LNHTHTCHRHHHRVGAYNVCYMKLTVHFLWSASYVLYSTRWQQIILKEFDKNGNNQYLGIRRIYAAWIWVGSAENRWCEKIFCSGFDVEFASTPDRGGGAH
jgi:hypothetical protein